MCACVNGIDHAVTTDSTFYFPSGSACSIVAFENVIDFSPLLNESFLFSVSMLWTVPSYSPSLVVTRNLAPTKPFLSAMFCCCYPEQPASAIYNTSARSQGPIVLLEGWNGRKSGRNWEQGCVQARHLGTDIQTRDNVKSDEEFFGDCPGSGPEPSCLLLLNLALNKPCAGGAAARCFIN